MKKYFASLLLVFSMICVNAMPINAFDVIVEDDMVALNELSLFEKNQIIEALTNQLYVENGEIYEIDDVELLYDVEMNPTYVMGLVESGYVIASRDNKVISEYVLDTNRIPYSDVLPNEIRVYGGPFCYEVVNRQNAYGILAITNSEFIEKNREFLSVSYDENVAAVYASVTDEWIGLDSDDFELYSEDEWINDDSYEDLNPNGICGTISSAVLLSYYDDYIRNMIPDTLREEGSEEAETLIRELYNYIDYGNNGTMPADVRDGITYFMIDYTPAISRRSVISGLTMNGAINVIDDDRPVIIGLLDAYGSDYGNHWVLAYQYFNSSNSIQDKFKAVDLWGDYDAVISSIWMSSYVAIDD